MIKFYTKKGDQGKTTLRNGRKVPKTEPIIETEGTLDELNSIIGLAVVEVQDEKLKADLRKTQSVIFSIGALLTKKTKSDKQSLFFLDQSTRELENQIDKIQNKIPQQKQFYLPGGNKQAAVLDFSRSICRRAERTVLRIPLVEPPIIKYLNRLSDYLYALARWINWQSGTKERIWRKS